MNEASQKPHDQQMVHWSGRVIMSKGLRCLLVWVDRFWPRDAQQAPLRSHAVICFVPRLFEAMALAPINLSFQGRGAPRPHATSI